MKSLLLNFLVGLIMSAVCCSFRSLVGGSCTFNKRDRKKSTEIVPLLGCNKDISGHCSSLAISDVHNEVDLVLARASIFKRPRNLATFTICPAHRSGLGVGWKRGSVRCRVPQQISKHQPSKQWPKAERGIGRNFSQIILRETGVFVAVGSGLCRKCRELLSSMRKDEEDQPVSTQEIAEESVLVSEFQQLSLAEQNSGAPTEKRESFYVPSVSDIDTSSDEEEKRVFPKSSEYLNRFLAEKNIDPVGSTLRTTWEEASKRTRRRHTLKASEVVSAVLDEIAPKDPGKLWHVLKECNAMKERFPSKGDAGSTHLDTVLLEALCECYENSSHWASRRQILSVMADKVSLPKLQKWIPGLTSYRYNVAKSHARLYGGGSLVSAPVRTRMRVSPEKLDHFLSFITNPHIIQDLPFGEKILSLSSGEVIRVPNVIRSLIPERIVAQYQSLCLESDFVPMSRSTLLRILSVCSASQRTSLQGLDYFSASGAKAFDDLEVVADNLGDNGMGMSWAAEKKQMLKMSKRYLKGDFKVHVCKSSNIPDHCISYAMSDPKDSAFQETCDHSHNQMCDRCSMFSSVLREIKEALQSVTECTSPDVREQWAYDIAQAEQAILAWKAHLVRLVNQDKARVEVVDNLDDVSVFLVQDWAMKFLPRKYRESQCDWFGKRGIPWHVTVAVRKSPELEMLTFVHIFPACPQDSHTVLTIMSDVIRQLKVVMPQLKSVFYRQDNAGCYHSSSTVVGAKIAAKKSGVSLERMDFSDPQGGKGACDRKAATVKSHVRVYLNSGHDVENAQQLKNAIQSDGGVPGVRVALCDAPSTCTLGAFKWAGISLLNNFRYGEDGITVWRAYGVGPGKHVSWDEVKAPMAADLASLVADDSHARDIPFAPVASRRQKQLQPLEAPEAANESCPDTYRTDSLFACPEEGCVMSYARFSSLQYHLDCGNHKRELEQETLQDKAMISYAQRLEEGMAKVPEFQEESHSGVQFSHTETELKMGWALKSAGIRRTRFSPKQKEYLMKQFQIGETTGRKANATDVARSMRSAREPTGDRLFTSDDFLTPQQVASFFSRLAANKTSPQAEAADESEVEAAQEEMLLQDIRAAVEKEVALGHPVIYDGHDICEMARQGKLMSFSIKMLQDLCRHFEMDISTIKVKRKKPYIDRVVALVKQCTCNATD